MYGRLWLPSPGCSYEPAVPVCPRRTVSRNHKSWRHQESMCLIRDHFLCNFTFSLCAFFNSRCSVEDFKKYSSFVVNWNFLSASCVFWCHSNLMRGENKCFSVMYCKNNNLSCNAWSDSSWSVSAQDSDARDCKAVGLVLTLIKKTWKSWILLSN